MRVCLKSWSPPAMNEFACSAYRSTLIRPVEREIKPPQNVVTNPFKCGGGAFKVRTSPGGGFGGSEMWQAETLAWKREAASAGLTNDNGSD